MKIKDYKCKCGSNNFFFADKGSQKGIYCSYCGRWFKWADKNEQNLALKKEPVLDKIKSEICKASAFYHGTELSYGLDLAIKIVDKYKAESEDK